MRIGVCTSVDNAASLTGSGIEFIEEHIQKFLIPDQDDAAWAPVLAKAKASPLPVIAANCYLPATLPCVGPAVDTGRLLNYGKTALRRAGQAGLQYLVLGSAGARMIPDGFPREKAREQFAWLVQQLAPTAQEHNVVIVVEALHKAECNFVNSLAEGAEFVREANHPHIWLLVDIFHMLRDNEPASEIVRFGDLIRHAHIAENEIRSAPGVKGDDFRPYLRALREIGYDGALAIESGWGNLQAELPAAVRALNQQIQEASC